MHMFKLSAVVIGSIPSLSAILAKKREHILAIFAVYFSPNLRFISRQTCGFLFNDVSGAKVLKSRSEIGAKLCKSRSEIGAKV